MLLLSTFSDREHFILAFKLASEPSESGTLPAPACLSQNETCSTRGHSQGASDDDSSAQAVTHAVNKSNDKVLHKEVQRQEGPGGKQEGAFGVVP